MFTYVRGRIDLIDLPVQIKLASQLMLIAQNKLITPQLFSCHKIAYTTDIDQIITQSVEHVEIYMTI